MSDQEYWESRYDELELLLWRVQEAADFLDIMRYNLDKSARNSAEPFQECVIDSLELAVPLAKELLQGLQEKQHSP